MLYYVYYIHTNNMDKSFDNNLLNLILTSKGIYNKFDMKKYVLVNKQFNYICKNYIIWIYMKDLNIMNYIKQTYPYSKCYMVIHDNNMNDIDLYTFKDLYMLDIYNCHITDVSMLRNLHTLNISCCYNITDVSMLGNLHTLDISRCYKITDVSMLGNLHTLDISYCNITDVSMLGKLHTLYISGCEKITDVSMLGNLHTLDICGCNITDVSMLRNKVIYK